MRRRRGCCSSSSIGFSTICLVAGEPVSQMCPAMMIGAEWQWGRRRATGRRQGQMLQELEGEMALAQGCCTLRLAACEPVS